MDKKYFFFSLFLGSTANEQGAIKYFMSYVQKLKSEANPIYEIEADVQISSGSYIHWEMINMYQSIQNFIIKINAKGCNSTSYLLVNSHYDSVPGGPGKLYFPYAVNAINYSITDKRCW